MRVRNLTLGMLLIASASAHSAGHLEVPRAPAILQFKLTSVPALPTVADQLLIDVVAGEADGIALVSEPSHVLVAYVLNVEQDPDQIARTPWFREEIAPLLVSRGQQRRRQPMKMVAPIRQGMTLGFSSLEIPENDDTLALLVTGDLVSHWRGRRAEALYLAHPGRSPRSGFRWTQSIALFPPGSDALDSFLCGCGDAPPPCGNGNGQCGACASCSDKPGAFCQCCLETTQECGFCGRSIATCGTICPLC